MPGELAARHLIELLLLIEDNPLPSPFNKINIEDFITRYDNTFSYFGKFELSWSALLLVEELCQKHPFSTKTFISEYQTEHVWEIKSHARRHIYASLDNLRSEAMNDISGEKGEKCHDEILQLENEISNYLADGIIVQPWIKSQYEHVKTELRSLLEALRIKIEKHDDRLHGHLYPPGIQEYFMQLNLPHKDGKPVLTKDQIDILLHANFKGFEPRTEIIKFDTPDCTAAFLRRFVNQFHKEFSFNNRTTPLLHFLKDNFSIFDNTSIKSIRANFSA